MSAKTAPPSTTELAMALGRRRATGVLRARVGGGMVQLFLLGGRLLWATSDDERVQLRAAFEAAGLLDDGSELVARTDDDLVAALVARGGSRIQLEAVRREVVRGRVRLAFAEGEDARFDEMAGELDGVDSHLLPDIDFAAIGQDARRSEDARRTQGPAPDSELGKAAHHSLERYHARTTENWYDLLGVRPSSSPASLRRAADECIASWAAVADHPGNDSELRRRASLMRQAAQMAKDRLSQDSDRDAYDLLLRRGGAPKAGDLVAEAEAPPADFAPTAETDAPTIAKTQGKKGFFARLFGGGGA
ncbi:MAG: hypothetical protein VX265_18215 [Myxococcota bacterium]|nr:hypothetical protein [Myxococcota bacterium]